MYELKKISLLKTIFFVCSSTLTGIHSLERHVEWFDDYKSLLRSEYTQTWIWQAARCTHIYYLYVYCDQHSIWILFGRILFLLYFTCHF